MDLPLSLVNGEIAVMLPQQYADEFIDACYELELDDDPDGSKEWCNDVYEQGHSIFAHCKNDTMVCWRFETGLESWRKQFPNVLIHSWEEVFDPVDDTPACTDILQLL